MAQTRIRAGVRYLIVIGGMWRALLGGAAPGRGSSFAGFDIPDHSNLFPPECNGRLNPVPCAHALFLNGESIRLDGKLDDPAWSEAVGATGFRVSDPDRGAIPT